MKADYGQDAPGLLLGFAAGGLAAVTTTAALLSWGHGVWTAGLAVLTLFAAIYLCGLAGVMVIESRITKIRDRDRVLDGLDWRDVRTVLDLGCGRGLMAIGAARRMTGGTVIGIDIWRDGDQSGNGPAAAAQNAALEGVSDTVRFDTADMRDLPFADGSFDLILSAWAIHNLSLHADRDKALSEAVRVLATNGTLVITDIEAVDDYRITLTRLGLNVQTKIVFRPVRERLLEVITFGSFSPATVIARRTVSA